MPPKFIKAFFWVCVMWGEAVESLTCAVSSEGLPCEVAHQRKPVWTGWTKLHQLWRSMEELQRNTKMICNNPERKTLCSSPSKVSLNADDIVQVMVGRWNNKADQKTYSLTSPAAACKNSDYLQDLDCWCRHTWTSRPCWAPPSGCAGCSQTGTETF